MIRKGVGKKAVEEGRTEGIRFSYHADDVEMNGRKRRY